MQRERTREKRKEKREKRRQPRPQLGSCPGALELRRVGIDLISQVKADADATELQGDGEALGGNARKTEDKRKKDRSRSSGAKEKATDRSLENSSGRGETENWTRCVLGWTEEGRQRTSTEHGSPIAEPARARNFSLFQKQLKNNLTGFQTRVERTRHRVSNVSSRARGSPLSHVLFCMRLLCVDNPRSSITAEPQRPKNPVV